MSGFGFKIVEYALEEIEPLVERSLRDHLPIEVGLYHGDPRALDYLSSRLPGAGLEVAVHLDHRRLNVFYFEGREAHLHEQLATAVRLGASYVITHISPYPMTPRPQMRTAMLDEVFGKLRSMSRICAEYGLDVHIENTYHHLAFYRWFFQELIAIGIERVHTCFDLGHAKVWSVEGLAEWLAFLAELDREGLRLHFHLHANRGLGDEHLSFITAERLGITRPDVFTGVLDYYQGLAEIAVRFPTASKVFEVPWQEAEENLDHVLGRISMVQPSVVPVAELDS